VDTKILQGFENQQHKLLEKEFIKDYEIQCENLWHRKSWGCEGVLEKCHHLPGLLLTLLSASVADRSRQRSARL